MCTRVYFYKLYKLYNGEKKLPPYAYNLRIITTLSSWPIGVVFATRKAWYADASRKSTGQKEEEEEPLHTPYS